MASAYPVLALAVSRRRDSPLAVHRVALAGAHVRSRCSEHWVTSALPARCPIRPSQGYRVTEPGRPEATPTTDFLWRMSSGLSRRASELLSGDVGQMMFLTIGNAVPPHDEDDLEPLSAQRAQRLTMSMPARALLIVIGARPVAAL